MERKVMNEIITVNGRTLVEVAYIDGYKKTITDYVVCNGFDASKPVNDKWSSGHYFTVYEDAEVQKILALRYLLGQNTEIEPTRLQEIAEKTMSYIAENMDEEAIEEIAEDLDLDEDERKYFGLKSKKKYRVVSVTVQKTYYKTVKVILPEDTPIYNADDIICDSMEEHEFEYDNDDYEIEYNDHYDVCDGVTAECIERNYSDAWNYDDFEEEA